MIKSVIGRFLKKNKKEEVEVKEDDEESKNESEKPSENDEDYDDEDSDEEDQDYDDDDEDEDYDFAFEGDDEMDAPQLTLVRAETKEISNDYNYKKLKPEEVLKILLDKINSLKDIYSYAHVDPTIYFTTLRKNLYIVREASSALEDHVLKLMETRAIKDPDFSEGPLFCNLCYFEVTKNEEGADFGCGHTFCIECMKEYVKVKIAEGPFSIFTKCPFDGCEFLMGVDVVSKVSDEKDKNT